MSENDEEDDTPNKKQTMQSELQVLKHKIKEMRD